MDAVAWIGSSRWHLVRRGDVAGSRCRRSRPAMAALTVVERATEPIEGQKTGTSGLRKRTEVVVRQPEFVCNWAQSLFDALGGPATLRGETLVVGGDGRYYNREAAQALIRVAAGNGFGRVVVAQDVIMSTPAVSAAIVRRGALGGIIMTASHNPGGPHGDWGIKYNTANGAPATEVLLDRVYANTLDVRRYLWWDREDPIDLSTPGETTFEGGTFVVQVIDGAEDHVDVLRTCFDFDELRKFGARPDFSMCFDAMNAVSGPSAKRVLLQELGLGDESTINSEPLEDFGGLHPDPNQTYAEELINIMDPEQHSRVPDLGAASDGDGDRNMVLGPGFFVTPSDSLAVIASYAREAIPYFADGLKGLARSMPTSRAVDRVADALQVGMYETPTGWKFFGNLMDAGHISLCGEESFGLGSDHIREKDGLWAVLAWLSILAFRNRTTPVGELIGVQQVVEEHWLKYGRHFYQRHDYENVDAARGAAVVDTVRSLMKAPREILDSHGIDAVDEFSYVDPVDGSSVSKQGVIVNYRDGSRVVVRLSGTGSQGATVRLYLERYESDVSRVLVEAGAALRDVAESARKVTKIQELTGRTAPTVVT